MSDPIVMQGWVDKWQPGVRVAGVKARARWSKRYFTLQGRNLSYKKDVQVELHPRGQVNMKRCSIQIHRVPKGTCEFEFSVFHKRREIEYRLGCSKEEGEKWIKALLEAQGGSAPPTPAKGGAASSELRKRTAQGASKDASSKGSASAPASSSSSVSGGDTQQTKSPSSSGRSIAMALVWLCILAGAVMFLPRS